MSDAVLDASALIAYLLNEPGMDRAAKAIEGASIGVVNFSEVVAYFAHRGMAFADIDEMLLPLPVIIEPADAELARVAGQFRVQTSKAGLSLGDRFCLALAKREGLPALTADRRWADVAEAVGVTVELIR